MANYLDICAGKRHIDRELLVHSANSHCEYPGLSYQQSKHGKKIKIKLLKKSNQ
jgi:hypothetical protein